MHASAKSASASFTDSVGASDESQKNLMLRIGIMSPEKIRTFSLGEVLNGKTLHQHPPHKPIQDGLFCERIFGPVPTEKDSHSQKEAKLKVRQEQFGRIELACPIAHAWFTNAIPSAIGTILNLSTKEIQQVIYFRAHLVVDPKETPLIKNQVLPLVIESEQKKAVNYSEACERFGSKAFISKMGAEALLEALQSVDLPSLLKQLREQQLKTKNIQTLKRIRHRMRLAEGMCAAAIKPEWMILTVLPVLPAGLRPLIELNGKGKFKSEIVTRSVEVEKALAEAEAIDAYCNSLAKKRPLKSKLDDLIKNAVKPSEEKTAGDAIGSSDLNELYTNVIRQNHRVFEALAESDESNLQIQKRKLQEAVDALLGCKPHGLDGPNVTSSKIKKLKQELHRLQPEEKPAGKQLRSIADECFKLLTKSESSKRSQLESLMGIQKRLAGVSRDLKDEKAGLQAVINEWLEAAPEFHRSNISKNKEYKSFAQRLEGKNGIIRRNLLGKRVDYSGRSVIVVGPELKLHQCGLPKTMAYTLFEPFIIHSLCHTKAAANRAEAERLFAQNDDKAWDALEQIVQSKVVLLNRAPTLHRLSVQAFEPILIEESVIRLHPLVCAGFAADFDGDTMAVHVPLSDVAQQEARTLMMSTGNFLNPANGMPTMAPSQDIILGSYYLTAEPRVASNSISAFATKDDVVCAAEAKRIDLHACIRMRNPDYGRGSLWGNAIDKFIRTTPGRVVFNQVWPAELGFFNGPADKKAILKMVAQCYERCGSAKTMDVLDGLKELGYRVATQAGISIGIDDLIISESLDEKIKQFCDDLEKLNCKLCTTPKEDDERTKAISDLKDLFKEAVTQDMVPPLALNRGKSEFNPVWIMLQSGARGSDEQIRQLIGVRGWMSRPGGRQVEDPILGNFHTGLTPKDYWLSTHGARKGISDRSMQTADAGYLTRKLVSAACDVIITEEDCGTQGGIWAQTIIDKDDDSKPPKTIVHLADRIIGRVACDDVPDPKKPSTLLVTAGLEITRLQADALLSAGISRIKIRSVLTCESNSGVCAVCYGHDLSRQQRAKVGDPIGVIAAQSIGEPGTQLTMRTFHSGGTVTQADITDGLKKVVKLFDVHKPKESAALCRVDGVVDSFLNENGHRFVLVRSANGKLEKHHIPAGRKIITSLNAKVARGQKLSDGEINPHELLLSSDRETVQEHLIAEIQKIYSPSAVINCKHIELMIHQLLRRLKIVLPGDTGYLEDALVDRNVLMTVNRLMETNGKRPVISQSVLLSISKAAMENPSFLGAAAFQSTTNRLTSAASLGMTDDCRGMQASVMTGQLIPAGTGFRQ